MSGVEGLAVSMPPERLALAAERGWQVELKLSRRHEPLVRGERDLGAVLDAAGLAPGCVRSVHLPPGLHQQGATGMTLTRRNRADVLDFVHDQLGVVPDAHLVAHPPKRFDYADQIELFGTLLSSVRRPIAVENTPGPSDWHTAEDVALFGYLADREPSLSGLYAAVDSAHLPPAGAGPGAIELDDDALAGVADQLREEGLQLPAGFREAVVATAADTADHRSRLDVSPAAEPYFPLLRALSLAGRRVLEVHLNDPVADGAPQVHPHDDHSVLRVALSILREHGGTVVVEDSSLLSDPVELARRVGAVADLLSVE